jgi:hypothetical protein
MFDSIDHIAAPTDEVIRQETPAQPEPVTVPEPQPTQPAELNGTNAAEGDWHAEAGRKGAHRIKQLIEEGKMYEKEHGLKRGRQRIRQLIELGKRYEQEHNLRPRRKHGKRLARVERDELLATLLHCLVRLAKPSFRAELNRLADALQGKDGQAA